MRRFEIVDGNRRRADSCATLVWDEDADTLSIEIAEAASENDVPMLFAAFIRKGQRIVDDEWARRWVEERVTPTSRQNLGQVLKANGLQHYDAMQLLIKAEGRCAQDDFYIREAAQTSIAEASAQSTTAQIAQAFVQARKNAGLSQMELAHRCGMKQPAISRLESGKANLTINVIDDVAKALGKQPAFELR